MRIRQHELLSGVDHKAGTAAGRALNPDDRR
jgi:hypothetical protein